MQDHILNICCECSNTRKMGQHFPTFLYTLLTLTQSFYRHGLKVQLNKNVLKLSLLIRYFCSFAKH
jgi:hypothetical protein